jgi:hypothetical protein
MRYGRWIFGSSAIFETAEPSAKQDMATLVVLSINLSSKNWGKQVVWRLSASRRPRQRDPSFCCTHGALQQRVLRGTTIHGSVLCVCHARLLDSDCH